MASAEIVFNDETRIFFKSRLKKVITEVFKLTTVTSLSIEPDLLRSMHWKVTGDKDAITALLFILRFDRRHGEVNQNGYR